MRGGLDAPRVILQDVRQFTVQIRDPAGERVLGTGVVISRQGLVATCAHVIRAGGLEPRASRRCRVTVYLPSINRGAVSAELRSAWVVASFSDSDDDLVCLQLDGELPLPHQRVAVLGGARDSAWHTFSSYGYRELGDYLGAWARGMILGEVEPPAGRRLLLDPVQLESKNIDAGMSGAAVLDVERNLVVGVVAETWVAEPAGKDRDTAWAVNAGLLELSPLRIDLRDDPLPLVHAEPPLVQPALAERARPREGARHMDFAPLPLAEWVGRDLLLSELTEYLGEQRHLVISLVGFGGEGKTSIARKWVEVLTAAPPGGQRLSVFWWSFTERASADDFLEAALDFVSGGAIAPGDLPDGRARAECVAGLLNAHPFLFVLDGLEVMQHQGGDEYGSVKSADLRDFLTFFATPDHRSTCLITTRAPVFDLVPYVTHRQVDVDPLDTDQGVELLRNLGVFGPDASLRQVVHDWGGHALTLSLVAAYLTTRHHGDVRRVTSLPTPDPHLPRDVLVRRVLQEYNASLSSEERTFLERYSVFRTPMPDEALRLILPEAPWAEADEEWQQARTAIFRHLLAARIVRRDTSGRTQMHPLVRDFFVQQAASDDARRALHRRAMEYYLSTSRPDVSRHTLEDLEDVVEAVHHACGAGLHDHACDLVHERLYEGDRGLLTRELNAYETALAVFADFYPKGELSRHPLVTDGTSRGWIQHEVAMCLQMLGRLREAAMATRRAMQAFKAVGVWHDAAVSCQNMAELYLSLGALPTCGPLIAEAYDLAHRAGDEEDVLVAETLRGALAYLEGRTEEAGTAFAEALRIAREHTPIPALYSSSGIRYADYLRRLGRTDEARRVHEVNLEVCRAAGWRGDEVGCLTGLGDLALESGDSDGARHWYDLAERISRGITRRDVLIGALLGQARWRLRFGPPDKSGLHDLRQALTMAVTGGYRLAEIEAHLLVAETYVRAGDQEPAWEALNQAEHMSIEAGYHWGRQSAQALTTLLDRNP
ncbi:trypsin-like peptidase domain-containing protein [Nonomuraea sp. NPDC049421]|uniref:trypsin-like peptidase domain-containing protein n=1 Tax=Nonomuraea sp. NPDC049421 TaxID=3155275 RepID=UPI00343039A7